MLLKKYVNYDDIVKNESTIIDFLINNSDSFSVTTVIKRPYSQLPPVFNYDIQLQPFVTDYIFERKDWLVDFLGKRKHQIMVVCQCCKESRNQLLQMPNVFLPIDNNMPEDICFYRKGKLWFATVSHEKIAFLSEATKEDIAFFVKNNIRVGCV
ncbi:MAG: hypothetical protein IJN39_02810 [Clostridia bacterium]|nr:hypothetical protein [Clostridia bacterium]